MSLCYVGFPYNPTIRVNVASCCPQALLEMGDIASAQAMVNYYADRPPQVRGRTVYIQFSNHEELKVESSSQVS